VKGLPAGRHAEKERLSANAYIPRSGPNARLAQWESITLTLWGSQVQSLHRAPSKNPDSIRVFSCTRGPGKVATGGRNSSRKGVQMRWIRGPNEGTGFGLPSMPKMRAKHRAGLALSADLARQPARPPSPQDTILPVARSLWQARSQSNPPEPHMPAKAPGKPHRRSVAAWANPSDKARHSEALWLASGRVRGAGDLIRGTARPPERQNDPHLRSRAGRLLVPLARLLERTGPRPIPMTPPEKTGALN
jgi:hypothetical protein